jgi:hypothetical protein
MAPKDFKATRPQPPATTGATPSSARDREMGRDAAPAGDLGHGHRTWSPPANEQGISNRPGDGHAEDGATADMKGRTGRMNGRREEDARSRWGHSERHALLRTPQSRSR